MSQQHSEEFFNIASVERYLKNLYATAESIIKGQRSTVELFERHLFKQISQFTDTRLWISLCVGFDNERRVATLPNLRMVIFGLIDKCYSSHLRRKLNLEQEGTVTLDCLLTNTDK